MKYSRGYVNYKPRLDYVDINDMNRNIRIILNRDDYINRSEFYELEEGDIIKYRVSGSGITRFAKGAELVYPVRNILLENVLTMDETQEGYPNYCHILFEYARYLDKTHVTMSNLRDIYRKVHLVDRYDDKLLALKKLRIDYIYLAGKNKYSKGLENFTELLDILSKKARDEKDVETFQLFVETIVEKHKSINEEREIVLFE